MKAYSRPVVNLDDDDARNGMTSHRPADEISNTQKIDSPGGAHYGDGGTTTKVGDTAPPPRRATFAGSFSGTINVNGGLLGL